MDLLSKKVEFQAPVVDRLSVRVVVDAIYDLFAKAEPHPMVVIEHARHIRGKEKSTLAGEWGLSLHLESRRGGDSAQYLLDFGYTPEVLVRNFDLLDLAPEKLNGLILSHGHLDHYGGLHGFLTTYRSRMRDDLRLFAGGEENFEPKWMKRESEDPIYWDTLDRAAISAAGVNAVCCETPQALHGPFTTGLIARDSFEHVVPNTYVLDKAPRCGAEGAMTTDVDHFTAAEKTGRLMPDQHPDEHAVAYVVQGRGLVVIASCGHAGIVNTVKTAMAVSGVGKLHAVLGGFHLGSAPQDYVEQTVDALQELDPDVVIPMHCSGVGFTEAMRRLMPERLLLSRTGSRFTFGA